MYAPAAHCPETAELAAARRAECDEKKAALLVDLEQSRNKIAADAASREAHIAERFKARRSPALLCGQLGCMTLPPSGGLNCAKPPLLNSCGRAARIVPRRLRWTRSLTDMLLLHSTKRLLWRSRRLSWRKGSLMPRPRLPGRQRLQLGSRRLMMGGTGWMMQMSFCFEVIAICSAIIVVRCD